MNRNGLSQKNSRGFFEAIIRAFMTIAVAAAASVPSSFTSTIALCNTCDI